VRRRPGEHQPGRKGFQAALRSLGSRERIRCRSSSELPSSPRRRGTEGEAEGQSPRPAPARLYRPQLQTARRPRPRGGRLRRRCPGSRCARPPNHDARRLCGLGSRCPRRGRQRTRCPAKQLELHGLPQLIRAAARSGSWTASRANAVDDAAPPYWTSRCVGLPWVCEFKGDAPGVRSSEGRQPRRQCSCCSEHRIMAGPGGLQTGPPQVTSRSGAPSRPRLRSVEGPDRVDVRVACVVRAPGDLEAQLASELPGAMETPWIASPTCCSTRRGSCTASGPTSGSQNCRSDRPLKRHEHRQVTDGKAPREVWGVPGDGWRSRSHSEGSSTPGRRCAEPRGRP
jgi:hypothetical protein